jgi:hypothetical protein
MSAMPRRSVPRGLVLSVAFFGVFVGHAITYVVLAGNLVVRSTMLDATGHGYLPVTVHATLALAVVGLAGVFLAQLGAPRATCSRLTTRVATFQVLVFAAIEVAERAAARAPLHDLTHVLPVGTIVQIGVALVVAAVIRVMIRAGRTVTEVLEAAPITPPRATVTLVAASPTWAPSGDRSIPLGRGPPR